PPPTGPITDPSKPTAMASTNRTDSEDVHSGGPTKTLHSSHVDTASATPRVDSAMAAVALVSGTGPSDPASSVLYAAPTLTSPRSGPVTRSAGRASGAPIAPATSPAAGKASQKLIPFKVRIAAV